MYLYFSLHSSMLSTLNVDNLEQFKTSFILTFNVPIKYHIYIDHQILHLFATQTEIKAFLTFPHLID